MRSSWDNNKSYCFRRLLSLPFPSFLPPIYILCLIYSHILAAWLHNCTSYDLGGLLWYLTSTERVILMDVRDCNFGNGDNSRHAGSLFFSILPSGTASIKCNLSDYTLSRSRSFSLSSRGETRSKSAVLSIKWDLSTSANSINCQWLTSSLILSKSARHKREEPVQ